MSEEVDLLKSEIKRLKDHLLNVEEDYTQEILAAERREVETREQLGNAQKTIAEMQAKLIEVSQTSKWQEKLAKAIVERDKALDDVSKLDDKVHRLTASVTNLQLVIEQMQKENEKKLAVQAKQHTAALEAERCVQSNIKRELEMYEAKYQETSQALQAASRLTERIDKKESIIDAMKQEIAEKENHIVELEKEIANLKASFEGKVDKQIIKNLVLGYFGTAADKKHEVERLLARILDFNQEEMARAGLTFVRSPSFARLSQASLLSPNSSTGSDQGNSSLSKMFVEFLENESNPKANKLMQSNLTRELARDLTRVALTPNRVPSFTNPLADRQMSSKSNSNGPPSSSSSSSSLSSFVPASSFITSPSSSLPINNVLTVASNSRNEFLTPELAKPPPPPPQSSHLATSFPATATAVSTNTTVASLINSYSNYEAPLVKPVNIGSGEKCNTNLLNADVKPPYF